MGKTLRSASMLLPLVALLPSACGPHPQVTSFNVLPPLVCPGQSAVVNWNVLGRASLRAERGAADWDEGAVPSEGSRTVVPAMTTTFKITALDANPADGASYGTKLVQIPRPAQNKAATSTCDAASRKCKGSFVLDNGGGAMRALTLSAPTRVRGGKEEPAKICVTHDGLPTQTCVPAGGSLAIGPSVAAEGSWTLESELGVGDGLEPPPQLRIHFDFGCP
jgi:hypothetical protein